MDEDTSSILSSLEACDRTISDSYKEYNRAMTELVKKTSEDMNKVTIKMNKLLLVGIISLLIYIILVSIDPLRDFFFWLLGILTWTTFIGLIGGVLLWIKDKVELAEVKKSVEGILRILEQKREI